MPLISSTAIKKQRAIEKATHIMQEQSKFSTESQSDMIEIFEASGYLQRDMHNLLDCIQLVCSILYEHWMSSKEPIFYRQTLIGGNGRVIAKYSLSATDVFKASSEMK